MLSKIETPFGFVRGYVGRCIFIPVDADMDKLKNEIMCGQMRDDAEIYVVDGWAFVPQYDGLALPFKISEL